jgi:hypothetical protein
MKKLILLLLLSIISNIGFCQAITKQNSKEETKSYGSKKSNHTNDCQTKKDIQIKLFPINKEWGFDILVNNANYIHQTNIPAINGSKAFETKKDALKIAKLMKLKICKNILPPTISMKEIDSLLYKKKD